VRRRTFLALTGGAAATALTTALGATVPPLRQRRSLHLVERWSWAMGQPVHLRLFHRSEQEGLEAAQAALAELRRVEARLSIFDDGSDLSELNRQAGGGWWRADTDLLNVLEAAERFRGVSGGAFNVAVEPLMRVWGFRSQRKAAPGERELAEAEAAVRAASIRFDGDRVALPASHTALDLGGIGVGYALDRAGALLRRRGIESALLDVSGDLLAIGAPPGGSAWQVEIADPKHRGRWIATASLRDAALATSGNDATVMQYGARRIGHVMDPGLGIPAAALTQVTVVAPTALEADASSTAMLVSGVSPNRALRVWALR
jgi:thiamine biosynthesis lipoprotein